MLRFAKAHGMLNSDYARLALKWLWLKLRWRGRLVTDGLCFVCPDVSAGVARVRLGGVCSGCPSTIMAVIMGIEQELRRHVPEVEYLEAVP